MLRLRINEDLSLGLFELGAQSKKFFGSLVTCVTEN
jgi:hypothetical protein